MELPVGVDAMLEALHKRCGKMTWNGNGNAILDGV